MKKFRKLAVCLMAILLLVCGMSMTVFAATSSQDGLTIEIKTDKDAYSINEDIKVEITVTNTNAFTMENVTIESLLPEGLELKSGTLLKVSANLAAGETAELSAVAVLKNSTDPTNPTNPTDPINPPNTGDSSVAVLKNSTDPTNPTNPTDPINPPNTGDSSVAVLKNSTDPTNPTNPTDPINPPNTGDSSNIVLWLVLALVSSAGVFFTIKYRKKAAKVLSLVLCISMLAGTLVTVNLTAFAAVEAKSFQTTHSITIEKKAYDIKVVITYDKSADSSDDTEIDTDGDGLSDYIESLLETDPSKTDTDGDGLSDYVEYKLGLDPLSKDTDGNGITDDQEDTDGDGLTNIEEVNIGSNPGIADTDGDGLNDGEEVKTYSTSPINVDTDGDGLTDYEEVQLGLDPTNPKTDGVTDDALRKFDQKIKPESIGELLTSSDNLMIPSISGNVSGYLSNNVKLEQAIIDSFDDNRSVISPLVELQTTYTTPLTLSFDFSGSSFSYAGDINNLVVFKYDGTDLNPLETNVDVTNSVISAEVKGEGSYFVVDLDEFLKSVGINVFRNVDTTEPAPMAFSALSALATPLVASSTTETMGKADIVFVIDVTGSMGSAINNVKNNVNTFAEKLVNDYNIDANFALIEFQDITYDGIDSTKIHKSGISNWFTDVNRFKDEINSLKIGDGGDTPETPIDGLEAARRLDYRSNANRFVILITDAPYKTANNYDISDMDEMARLFVEDSVVVSVISYNPSVYADLNTKTGGLYGNIYGNFSDILLGLADKVGEVTNDGEWILLDDYQAIKLEAPLSESKDTDKDGLSDRSELISSYKKDLSVFVELLLTLNSVPRDMYKGETSVTIWSYKSNPVLPDTDFDGIDDNKDSVPRDNSFKGKLNYNRNRKSFTSNIEFSVDYRNFFSNNQTYSEKISVMSSLFAADIYNDTYVSVTSGASGGSDNATSLGKLFGLSDVENIKIEAKDYSVDKDDLTEIVIGHRLVEYKGTKKEIIILSVRGTNGTNAEWSSNFDVGADTTSYYNATGTSHPDWMNKQNHKGFDVASNRVLTKVNDYFTRHGLTGSKNILVIGHSRGAAIANLLGAHFENDASSMSYTYTFAAPNPTTATNASSYKTIFNIVNSDDIIPALPLAEWGFTKYGVTKSISVESCYENKWGKRQEGTWEWLVGVDYNNDGGTQRTLGYFAKIANNRNDLYVLDTSSNGKVWENNMGHTTREGAEKELAELTKTLESEKLLKFCKLSIVGGGFLTPYHVEVNYCPAYLMQSLANMTTGVGPLLGHDVKGKYASAKASFVGSSGKVVVGGMEDPHMPITYYLIAYNNFATKV